MLKTLSLAATLAFSASGYALAQEAQPERPNILVIFGDDIGQTNLSIYSNGLMGYRTPNIDRIGEEGAFFTDYYAEQSCTAGRSTFITGQVTLRTGLSKVGLPGADVGLQASDATIASALKDLGYATGQFGKNHLGDKDEFLPTNHGFDEFFGNLYHLNAEEEPESFNYPQDPAFREQFGPRGVIKATRRRPDRGHRPADPQAHGDRRRRDLRRRHRLHPAPGRRRYAVLHLDEHHPDARPHPRAPRAPR